MNKPKVGRPPSKNPKNVLFQVRLTAPERDKIKALGGSAWVRQQLAKEAG